MAIESPDITSGVTSGPTPDPPTPAGTCTEIIDAGAELTELLERLVRRHAGMTMVQFRTVELLAATYPTRLEPWEVGETLGLSSNHVSMVLDQLEAKAYVKRHSHPHDGRRRLIEVTGPGREAAAQVSGLTRTLEARVMATALTPDEHRQLNALLERVRAATSGLAEVMRRRPGP
jgi:DNA-binding MarR family transcriptional regulator